MVAVESHISPISFPEHARSQVKGGHSSGEIELIQACDWLTADNTLDFQHEFYINKVFGISRRKFGHVLKPETTGTKQPERNNRNETTGTTGTTGTRIGKDRNHRNQNRTRNSTSFTSPGLITKSRHLLQRDLYFPRDFTNLRYRNGKRGRHGKARNKAIFFSNLHEDSTIFLLNSIR